MIDLQNAFTIEEKRSILERQQQRENDATKLGLSGDIEFFARFGRWQELIEKFEAYRQQFLDVPLELEILRLNALDGLSRTSELKKEIIRLEWHPEAAGYQAQLDLWRGYVFLAATDNETDARSLIQKAIDSGDLQPSDKWFAKGLIDKSLNDATEKYKMALQLSPFHSQARMQLIITLILLGRYDEVQQQLTIAETMFPNDSRYRYAKVVSHSLAANRPAAAKSRKELIQRTGTANLKSISALSRLSAAVNSQFRLYDRDGLLDWLSIMTQGYPLLFQDASYRAIPVPQFQKDRMSNAYGNFAKSFLDWRMKIATEEKKHLQIIGNCQRAWEIHEDGMFKCFEGWSWYELDEFEKSAEAFVVAANSDGLFPEIKNQGVYGAFISKKMQFDRSEDKTLQDEAMEYLEIYVGQRFETHRASTMFNASAEAGRWDLARKITEEMIRREGEYCSTGL